MDIIWRNQKIEGLPLKIAHLKKLISLREPVALHGNPTEFPIKSHNSSLHLPLLANRRSGTTSQAHVVRRIAASLM